MMHHSTNLATPHSDLQLAKLVYATIHLHAIENALLDLQTQMHTVHITSSKWPILDHHISTMLSTITVLRPVYFLLALTYGNCPEN